MHNLLLDLKTFRHFADLIDHADEGQIAEKDIYDDLAQLFPGERPKVLFKTMMGWARYAELFTFDQRGGVMKLFTKEYLGKPPASRLKTEV